MRLTGREVRIRHRSVTSILLNGCETWSLLADSELKIQAFETKCLQKILPIFYLELNTNDWVRGKISFIEGPQEPLLPAVKRRKLAWFGHVTRHDSLLKTILHTRAFWRLSDAVVGRGNAGLTTSKSGHSCQCQNFSQGSPAERTGRRSLLNRPLCLPDDPIGQGSDLN